MPSFPPYLVGRDLPEPVVKLEAAGQLSGAEREIDARLGESRLSPALLNRLTIERQRLGRLKRDFSLSPEAMLKKLQGSVQKI